MSTEPISFKDSLNLPKTDFPIRPNAVQDDQSLLERWKASDLYKKTFVHNEGKQKFILHDGPPYANGHIHLGHAYNKILKDIIAKSKRMAGFQVPVIPGWDCHGLPIELKVTQENPGLEGAALKKECRAYAQRWLDIQREEFKKLGVLFEWDRPYSTMSFGYEAAIVRAFGKFVEQGYIEKKKKTVAWCFHDKTVLASAEIEYKDRKDPSLYVLFALDSESQKRLFPALSDKKVSVVVWTTTPWTLPMNRAVLVKPKADYLVLAYHDQYIVVGAALAEKLCALLSVEKKVVQEISTAQLSGAQVCHPFVDELVVPILEDSSVTLEDGTAFVHCAPGCGPIDYDVGLKNNLEVYCPVDAAGIYESSIKPESLAGISITDAQGRVIKMLQEKGALLHKGSINHSYPHCWRCHNGLIFRATSQWFCSLTHNNFKQRALAAIETLQFFPARSINFLKATTENRLEWCLSRQRTWGVPIPALLCKTCHEPYISSLLVEEVARGIEQQGIEYWDTVESSRLAQNITCKNCCGTDFIKEKDILDVWFESGVSHYAVLYHNDTQAYPADVYAEGLDQHRAWFQSSLLTSLVLEEQPCTRAFYTHGFTVDQKGNKMSKSLGNVVSPDEIVAQLGTDGLRLWASTINNEGDAIVSPVLLKNVAEVYRKIRNTCRFLLSNMYDFKYDADKVPLEQLLLVDRYALAQLSILNTTVRRAYDDFDFTKVYHALSDYCATQLSSTYLDIIKDRLYVERADGFERRSAQTACWYILDTLTKLMAPILSFTAELVSDQYQHEKVDSIHMQSFADLSMIAQQESVAHEQEWHEITSVRSALLKAIELLREQGVIKHSLEAALTVYGDDVEIFTVMQKRLQKTDQRLEQFIKELLIVSQVTFVSSKEGLVATEYPGLYAKVQQASGVKCPRCWHWHTQNNQYDLCDRCTFVIQ